MELYSQTPQVMTTYAGPLLALEKKFLLEQHKIEIWLQQQWQINPAPFYGSVDLRNAGFKLAPIDMNLFPAGFNNLDPTFLSLSIAAAQQVLEPFIKQSSQILLIPEGHTRNTFYWKSIAMLLKILEGTGAVVRVGVLPGDFIEAQVVLDNGTAIPVAPLVRQGNRLLLPGFVPDLILLNNDLSNGIPEILQGLAQPILPPARLGWSQRLKSGHFSYYQRISTAFANLVEIDPWFISPLFRSCGQIDFMKREGEECLLENASALFVEIEQKYREYQVRHKPFIIVKADAGTYGIGVMTVRHLDELRNLNRKQRTRMSKTKGGQPINKVIVQEGVYTFESWGPNEAVAEPVVYLLGQTVIGGFYRIHQERGQDENLNMPGMKFEPLPFVKSCQCPTLYRENECQNRFYAYGVVARLSMLAAAGEMKEQQS